MIENLFRTFRAAPKNQLSTRWRGPISISVFERVSFLSFELTFSSDTDTRTQVDYISLFVGPLAAENLVIRHSLAYFSLSVLSSFLSSFLIRFGPGSFSHSFRSKVGR